MADGRADRPAAAALDGGAGSGDGSGDVLAELRDVSYQYPRAPAPVLRDVSLSIRRGEFLGIVGPTGAGKTTLCLSLSGIVPQFYGGRFWGRVTACGLDTLEQPIRTLSRHVGQVFEDPETQLIATSIENEIAFALENLEVPRDEIAARIPRVLEQVRLGGLGKKAPAELSGGQKQRLAIAAALAPAPSLLVLDEPTAQLDPVGAQEIFATLRELNRELGMTVVLVSHATEELAEHADRVLVLADGAVQALGPAGAVLGDVPLLERFSVRPPQSARTFFLLGAPSPLPTRLDDATAALVARPAPRLPALPPPPPPPSGPPLISARGLRHRYADGTEALRGIDLDIAAGEYVILVGQNGAGKSTLVRHFLRLLEPSAGTLTVGGVPVQRLSTSALARRIGYVAQNPDNQIFSASVEDEVSFALRHLGFPASEIESRTAESLAAMGLLEARKAHPLSLPKGDRARLVVAAVLAMRPEAVIFDEPTTGQDFRGAKLLLDVTRTLHRAGKTVIVVTHHLYLMPGYAERVVVLGQGEVLLDAPIRTALHEVELLRQTFLTPPQAVLLARAVGEAARTPLPLLTPEELAQCFPGASEAQP